MGTSLWFDLVKKTKDGFTPVSSDDEIIKGANLNVPSHWIGGTIHQINKNSKIPQINADILIRTGEGPWYTRDHGYSFMGDNIVEPAKLKKIFDELKDRLLNYTDVFPYDESTYFTPDDKERGTLEEQTKDLIEEIDGFIKICEYAEKKGLFLKVILS